MSNGEKNSGDQRWKPELVLEEAPNCPRCDSSNTKFCYYNNYSLTQPRYFCKGCRRYWTKGGSLRNVPVGGGCRKNRRGKISRTLLNTSVIDGQTQKQPSSSSSSSSFQTNPAVRPDVLLDDPMGIINNGLNCTGLLSSPSSTTDNVQLDGSGIDLAVLYAKFSSSNGNLNYQDHHHQIGFRGEYQQPTPIIMTPSQVDIPALPPPPEVNFNTNCGSSSSQLILLTEESHELFWPSCMSTTLWDHDDNLHNQASQSQFDFVQPPIPDDSSLLLDQNLVINNSWNMNMFDSLCFEARS
ncbi:hypothetical protein ZOSMA_338G00010 [Zostera marina]|uniref:Dof zinc finger protein n=1 Tax=Zostera marina TaxID=29655 RepID=A0A0K9P7X7_ZOSMR|nr:hypothetical protein ZOSMA_338G00010 [Zostera marina]